MNTGWNNNDNKILQDSFPNAILPGDNNKGQEFNNVFSITSRVPLTLAPFNTWLMLSKSNLSPIYKWCFCQHWLSMLHHIIVKVQWSAVITRSNLSLYYIKLWWRQRNVNQISNSQQTSQTSSSRASYGVSIMRILKKIDRVIMALHCIMSSLHFPFCTIFPLISCRQQHISKQTL